MLNTKVFDIIEVEKVSASGHQTSFILMQTPDWVNVVPVTRDATGRECFLMVHQYRQAGQCLTIEFPGGVLEAGEDPAAGAERELLEETGYTPGKLSLAGKTMSNPAIMDNWVYTFVAEDLHKASEQNLDQYEEVDYELIPMREVQDKMGTGPYCHIIMMAALDWYNRWRARSL